MKDKSMTEKAEAYDYLINLFKIFTMLGISFGLFQLFSMNYEEKYMEFSLKDWLVPPERQEEIKMISEIQLQERKKK